MRYLGNKDSVLSDIHDLLNSNGLLLFNGKKTFFDAFCGTGSVADYFKQFYHIVLNDSLKWSSIYSRGRVCAPKCKSSKLGTDPFEYLNSHKNTFQGFIYNNYAPTCN